MATVDGHVSQQDVVRHLKAGDLMKEKIVGDFGLSDFGNDDCRFLVNLHFVFLRHVFHLELLN